MVLKLRAIKDQRSKPKFIAAISNILYEPRSILTLLLKMPIKVELESVIPTDQQIAVLFEQLKKRKHSISHEYLPVYEEHEQFVKNSPYRSWFIVKLSGSEQGNVYVQFDNSIGLNGLEDLDALVIQKILNLVFDQVMPLDPIPSVRYADFFFNISINNTILMDKLTSIGYVQSGVTYIPRKTLKNDKD